MIDLAFNSLVNKLKEDFTEVSNIYLNWQGANIKVKYPYMVVLTVRSSVQFFTPSMVERLSDTSVIMNTGQWETRINIHYLADQGTLANQSSVIQRMVNFFQSDLTSNSRISPTLVLPFGDQSYKKSNISLLGYELDQNGGSIRKGERRTIFELLMDTPRLIQVDTPLIKDIIQNTEVL